MSLRLANNSGKTVKTPVYKVVAVYSWDRDDVTLEDVSSTQQYEENSMIPLRVKKQQVLKRGCQVSYFCLKISQLYLTHS